MRHMIAAVLIALSCTVLSPAWAVPQTEILPPTQAQIVDKMYPLALAAGALAGVAAVNLLTYGVGALPLVIGTETAAPIISPAAAAASRIFVITSGVLGAWIADALYRYSR